MKRFLFVLVLGAVMMSCEKKTENTMTVSGNIKGLKKGKLFLQQIKDSALVVLDSMEIQGNGAFSFSQEIESPYLFYLFLEKEDNNDINDRITFFGEPGEIAIKTSWNTFDMNPEVFGSRSHLKYEEFNNMISNFNIRELELIQQGTSPELQQDSVALDSIQKLINKNLLSQYLYTLNFGLNNGNSYVTPYVMLTSARDANRKYLDSVYKMLTPKVAASKYGKAFKKYLVNE